MKIACYGLVLLAAWSLGACRADAQSRRAAVSFGQVQVQDSFWSPKLQIYRERTVPHNWNYLAEEIEDNEIAAGWKQIERESDTPWNQANLHKALETCAYALPQGDTSELDRKLDGIIAAIAGAQQPDGYVNALITVRRMTPWENLDGQHDGYVAGHLIEAAVAHHLATGKRSFLDVACKLADHIHRRFVVENHEGVCGHAELELALVRLYRVTGQRRYLELAQEWIERRGKPWNHSAHSDRAYFMDHLPIREVPEVVGHAVRTMFYVTGVAEVANETGDKSLQTAARRLWEDTTLRKMYLTGSVGSREKDEAFGPAYELPNNGYCESCAACGLVYLSQAMFLLDGKAESMDVLERTLYNAVLHGIALDGTSTYYRNPLTDANHQRDNCWVCCPPCLSRTLLRLPDYLYATTPQSLYVNLYAGGTAQATVGGRRIGLQQETRYPWEGQVKLTVTPDRPADFYLRLRVPGWCETWSVAVNGTAITKPKLEQGYVTLKRTWRAGDVVTLDFAMPAQRLEAHPAVKDNHGLVALQRGPLVYGFEGLDNDGYLDFTLATDPELQAEYREDFHRGVQTIIARSTDGRHVRAIPFYALANREPSSQRVWVQQAEKRESAAGWEGKLYRPYQPLP